MRKFLGKFVILAILLSLTTSCKKDHYETSEKYDWFNALRAACSAIEILDTISVKSEDFKDYKRLYELSRTDAVIFLGDKLGFIKKEDIQTREDYYPTVNTVCNKYREYEDKMYMELEGRKFPSIDELLKEIRDSQK